MKKRGFLSLKWKFAILIGGVFLFLHTLFSYFLYLDVSDDFLQNRQAIQNRYQHIAEVLSEDSFLVLGQVTELLTVVDTSQQNGAFPETKIRSIMDKNWQQWQFIWGIESAVYFNNEGVLVKQWGEEINPKQLSPQKVLKAELPDYQIICPDNCLQFVMIPVMSDSNLIGVFGISRSFADIVIEYNRITGSDIGVLVNSDMTSSELDWPYKISAMTNIELNRAVLSDISREYSFDQFFEQRKEIVYQGRSFEVKAFSVKANKEQTSPFFLIIDDISDERKALIANLQTIWLYGIISLVASLFLLLLALFFSLRRIVYFSNALPLLAEKNYDKFRQLLGDKSHLKLGYDELDLLHFTALELTDQLEDLEQEIKGKIFQLLEKSQELTTERDFIHQLVNVAPILIVTQNSDGIISSINSAGVSELGIDEKLIIGNIFDNFIPETETEHLLKLKQLRSGISSKTITIDGVLLTPSLEQQQISWIHSKAKLSENQKEFIILSLGVDITERKKIEDKMLKIATHDQLTGLSNRRNFQLSFTREIATAKRYGTQLALFYLDLDQFKIVNDTNGHEVGDSLLRLVAKTLEEVVRETDILSRVGGDEFTLIMPNADHEGVVNVARKINDNLLALDFWVGDKHYKISTSIGVAIYPMHGANEHELLSNADLAMYQAKDSGRGRYHIFSLDNDYQSRLTIRLHWKDIIEEALEKERFVLFFQPILDLKTNEISHYECLTRIQNKDGSLLMPSDFIGFAEELGLIGKIDRMGLKKAIEQQQKFNKQGKDYKLAVNFSGRSFSDNTIFEDVEALLDQPGVDPTKIIFEITETAAVSNFSAAKSLIERMKGLGCSLALDDFGVGFSSFHYLKHLPVDYVKIDGSFIKNIDSNYEDKVFVKALIEVSQALGKKTVAEFVENEAVLQVLKEFGVDYAQGYYIGKPTDIS